METTTEGWRQTKKKNFNKLQCLVFFGVKKINKNCYFTKKVLGLQFYFHNYFYDIFCCFFVNVCVEKWRKCVEGESQPRDWNKEYVGYILVMSYYASCFWRWNLLLLLLEILKVKTIAVVRRTSFHSSYNLTFHSMKFI